MHDSMALYDLLIDAFIEWHRGLAPFFENDVSKQAMASCVEMDAVIGHGEMRILLSSLG